MTTTVLPSGPRGHFLTGSLPEFGRDPLGFLTSCAREYGDFVPARFGPAPTILLNHPALVEEVLVTQNQHFIKPYFVRGLRPLVGNGLLTSEGQFWLRQRRLAQPAFHRQRIAGYGEVMVAYAERMLATWQEGEVRDIHTEMMGLTLKIVAGTLFGADLTDEVAVVEAALPVALEALDDRLTSLWYLLPASLPTPTNRRLRAAVRQLDAIVYRVIDERRRGGEERSDLLSLLLHAQDEDGSHMTDLQLRDEVMTVLLAGHETTALALSWAWWLLAQHPAVEDRLLDELVTVLGGRSPSVADVANLPYTEAIISETLRLYPPAWAIGREASQDCQIGGYPVRKGTTLSISQWVLHRDGRNFDQPDAFRPERWLDGLARRLPRFAYFPFGGGPRLCIGSSFAMLEAVVLLATIAQQVRLTLVPGHPVIPEPTITLRPKHGVMVTLHRR